MSIFRCAACGRINRVRLNAGEDKAPRCGQCKVPLDTSGKPQDVDAAAFQRAVKHSPVPVLVDVWAPWCGPCRMVAPVVKEVGTERAGRLLVLKLNSDDNRQLSSSLRILGIPTMLLFEGGKEKARQSGAMPKAGLDAWLNAQL